MSVTVQFDDRWVSMKSRETLSLPEPEIATARDDRDFAQRLEMLTIRERQVLRLRAQGLSSAEMADRLFLCPQTIKNHLHRATRKLICDGIDPTAKITRACYLLGRFESRQERKRAIVRVFGREQAQ
jgi:DNA-binding CsgD family transcriptional regulator